MDNLFDTLVIKLSNKGKKGVNIQKIKNKIFKPKRLIVVLGILVLLFLSFFYFRFSFAYPSPRINYRDILPSYSTDFNDLLDFNIEALIQASLHDTLNDLPTFKSLNFFQKPSLPLETATGPRGESFQFQDIFNLKDLDSKNIEEVARSVAILTLRLFIIAIISVVQVFKVFFDLFMSKI